MSIRFLTLLLLGAAVLHAAAPVHAQQPAELDKQQLAIARALFEEGLSFMDSKQWRQAADRFARVLQMKWSPVVAYNLGSALVELGEIGEAMEHLRRVLKEPDLEDDVRQPAQVLFDQAEARMGRIRIMIHGDSAGLSVLLDGSEWPTAAIGVAVPMAPGRHSVVLMQGAEEMETREIFVAEREQLDVTFDRTADEDATAVAPAPAEVAAAAPPQTDSGASYGDFGGSQEADRDDDGDSVLGAWWLWTGVGVAVLAGVVTAVAVSADPDPATPIRGDFMPGVIEGKVQ